ncbi:hypothetical protein BaRGS_00004504, partial [Batillaria attramentaria]
MSVVWPIETWYRQRHASGWPPDSQLPTAHPSTLIHTSTRLKTEGPAGSILAMDLIPACSSNNTDQIYYNY